MTVPRGETKRPARRSLLVAGLVIGVWASLPPFVGPSVDVDLSTEIVDHPVPAVLVLLVCGVLTVARTELDSAWFGAGLLVLLAGLWLTITHLPLVAEAARGGVGWLAAVHHTLPGVATLGLAVVWSWRER